MPEPEELPVVSAFEADPTLMSKLEGLLYLSEENLLAMLGEEFMKLPEAERARILAQDISPETS
jgi:hypothetical protein